MNGDEMLIIFYEVMVVLGIVYALAGSWLPFLFWKRWVPKPSKTIFWANRRKNPLALIVHDSGRSDLVAIVERRGEGVVVLEGGKKYKVLPRYLSTEESEAMGNAEATEPTEETKEAPQGEKGIGGRIRDYSAWIVKRSMLIGLGVPILVGYSGKICLLNPEALALYEAGEMYVETEDKPMFKKDVADKKDKTIEDAVQPLLLLDPKKIKTMISSSFDDSQIAAIMWDSEEIGRYGRGFAKMLPWLLIIGIAVIAVIGVIFFLPQIMKGFGGGAALLFKQLVRGVTGG